MSTIDEPKGVVSVHTGGHIIHTVSDCPFHPTDYRPTEEPDLRKGRIRMCNWCDSHAEE